MPKYPDDKELRRRLRQKGGRKLNALSPQAKKTKSKLNPLLQETSSKATLPGIQSNVMLGNPSPPMEAPAYSASNVILKTPTIFIKGGGWNGYPNELHSNMLRVDTAHGAIASQDRDKFYIDKYSGLKELDTHGSQESKVSINNFITRNE
ncbi:hypothetical protein BDK51DRAFT_34027 [Blyttiomyces helicus]|uniref:Uncharacterized protein n=1 Tax=Blyttiomyces helicus TaxID=388810 RepID=A0A4P9WD03_9FUNG|nr:hypothetical protein BDK51DRAFT_34027 [Blyttiomyces helicus]|eukprot:RKO89565.1 hypothetical protein BDK51DRAFT_34027 [Blyttiomyces helicus]